MNKEELKKILPHREPMLLPDEVRLEDGVAVGQVLIRGDEWFLQGHFPGEPLVPGVIQCEILAQTSCVLFAEGEAAGKISVLSGLDKVRFKRPVRPGDLFRTRVWIVKQKHPFYWLAGEAHVDGELAVKAEFSVAVRG
ncbi:MAG: beta-hydroxyacyl-ACP dehydratase [Clostridiales Family XIII bacterium]|jgi:3-hydroxyacyl-[acyl-carrier-protein] dehydratase|nr:beta-hydroxyacyl-ACP dehydratase [Clostridiales Family XIII bacterium]